jgi:hypothetical protein
LDTSLQAKALLANIDKEAVSPNDKTAKHKPDEK